MLQEIVGRTVRSEIRSELWKGAICRDFERCQDGPGDQADLILKGTRTIALCNSTTGQ